MKLRSCYAVLCALLLLGCARALAEDFTPVVREASFAEGGVVILDANIGDVHVQPAKQDGKLRLVITPHKQDDATAAPHWVREFAVNGSQAKIMLNMPKHGDHNFDVTLYVPRRSDLRLKLEVGDLTVEGITGNTEVELGIGDLRVRVPDPHAYRAVAMSVHIGDVDASAFQLEPHGFLGKSVQHDFSSGSYRLKLHTGIGDVSCVAGTA
jgi:Putative adhesin